VRTQRRARAPQGSFGFPVQWARTGFDRVQVHEAASHRRLRTCKRVTNPAANNSNYVDNGALAAA
jgi:hypothetical protein